MSPTSDWKGTYRDWQFYVGAVSLSETTITQDNLTAWAQNPKREFDCLFCGKTYNSSQLLGEQFCPKCHENKGIVPSIPKEIEEAK